MFVVKIPSQKNCVNILYEFLNDFFAQETKSWIIFQDLVGILKLVES
jgi:hypothetical protein